MTRNTDFEMEYVNEDEHFETRVYRVQTGMEFTIRGEMYLVMEVDGERDYILTVRNGICDDENIEIFGIREVYDQLPEDARILIVGQNPYSDFRVEIDGNTHLYRLEREMKFNMNGETYEVLDVHAVRDYIEAVSNKDEYCIYGINDVLAALPASARLI